MTVEEYLREYLFNCLMWPADIDVILSTEKAADYNECMRGRWEESVGDYPPVLMGALELSTRTRAIEWLTEHKPKAISLQILKSLQGESDASK